MTIRVRLMLSLLLLALLTVLAGAVGLWAIDSVLARAAEVIANTQTRQQGDLILEFTDRTTTVANLARLALSLLMVGATLLAVGTAWVLARAIRRPTRSLRKAMRQFGEGDTAARADVPADRSDELVSLSQTFNEMANTLQDRLPRTEPEA